MAWLASWVSPSPPRGTHLRCADAVFGTHLWDPAAVRKKGAYLKIA